MELSIKAAAQALGKNHRQIRYLIQSGRLPAQKKGGRWIIQSKDLPQSKGQLAAAKRADGLLREAVEEALTPRAKRAHFSVSRIKAFEVGLPLYRKADEIWGSEHAITLGLRRAMEHLSQGAHRFNRSRKHKSYSKARDAASQVICTLWLENREETLSFAKLMESEWMPAFAGLLRKMEKQGR